MYDLYYDIFTVDKIYDNHNLPQSPCWIQVYYFNGVMTQI